MLKLHAHVATLHYHFLQLRLRLQLLLLCPILLRAQNAHRRQSPHSYPSFHSLFPSLLLSQSIALMTSLRLHRHLHHPHQPPTSCLCLYLPTGLRPSKSAGVQTQWFKVRGAPWFLHQRRSCAVWPRVRGLVGI